jgi:hypothetical protein
MQTNAMGVLRVDFIIIIIFGTTALYEPWLSLDFLTAGYLRDGAVNPTPNTQPGVPGLRICDPRDRVTQLYPQALGTLFSRLLRHAWATLSLFLSSGHHTELEETYLAQNRDRRRAFVNTEMNLRVP